MNTNQTTPQTVTRTIAGSEITLPTGWYIASRPMATRRGETYPITIHTEGWHIVATIDPMTYDEANEFLNAFNNGAMSFDGRDW